MGYKTSMKNWEGLAQNDALWSILTDNKQKGEKWDKEQFYASGKNEVDGILGFLDGQHMVPIDKQKVLDFGCGAGRISRGLSSHFDKVIGVDASPTMVELAKAEHKEVGDKIEFVLNQEEGLAQFEEGSFSMTFSVITLQHIPSEQSVGFIKEFIRLIKPGGLAVFQIPTKDVRKLSLMQRLRTFLRIRERLALLGIGKGFQMDMHPVDEKAIRQVVKQSGGDVLLAVNTNQTEPDYNGHVEFLKDGEAASGYLSRLFVVGKR